jgi:hypothetical protein
MANAAAQIGENVEVEETAEELILKIKKAHRGDLSSSGKTIRVASTLGNKKVGDLHVGLNVYVKPTK